MPVYINQNVGLATNTARGKSLHTLYPATTKQSLNWVGSRTRITLATPKKFFLGNVSFMSIY